jgi:exosortase
LKTVDSLDQASIPLFVRDRSRWLVTSRYLYLQVAVVFALVTILYYDILVHLVSNWIEDPNYSYAFLVPLFAGFLIWERRHRWMVKQVRPVTSGAFLILAAMMLLLVGRLGAELFLSRVSFVILLGGLALYFAGWEVSKSLLAPWLVLFLMIPLPVIIFNEIAFPLQTLASALAGFLLNLMHVPAVREGNVISLHSISLNVVEACSGIRSLMSLASFAFMYGIIAESRIWMRCLLVLFAAPTAVGTNALRIVGVALLGEYKGPQYAEGFFHEFSGWLIFLLAVCLILGLHAAESRIARRRVIA